MQPTQRQSMQRRYHALHRDLCRDLDLPTTSDYRHQVAEWILGYRKSSSQWTGKEYSIVIDQLREWQRGGTQPHSLDQDTRNRRDFNERKKQLIYAIEHSGAPDAYIQAIAKDRHGNRPWRDLGTLQLQRLRYTITARMHAKQKASHAK